MRAICVVPILVISGLLGGCFAQGSGNPATRSSESEATGPTSGVPRSEEDPSPSQDRYQAIVISSSVDFPEQAMLNDAGQVAGNLSGGDDRGFFWDPGRGMTTFDQGTRPAALNNRGQVAGVRDQPNATTADFDDVGPFLWGADTGFVDIGLRSTKNFRFTVTHLSDDGRLAGRAEHGAFNEDGDRATQAAVWSQEEGVVRFGRDGTDVDDVSSSGVLLVHEVDRSREENVDMTWTWTPGTPPQRILTSKTGRTGSQINRRGEVLLNEGYEDHHSLWDPDTRRQTVVALSSVGWGKPLNDIGQVGGACMDVGRSACVWDKESGVRLLDTVPGTTDSKVEAINSRGQAVGDLSLESASTHAFVWDPLLGMTDLGGPSGHRGSRAVAINERGDVLGIALDSYGGDADAHILVLWRKTGP